MSEIELLSWNIIISNFSNDEFVYQNAELLDNHFPKTEMLTYKWIIYNYKCFTLAELDFLVLVVALCAQIILNLRWIL